MIAYRKTAHPAHRGGWQGWEETETADTLNIYDNSETRTPVLIVKNEDNIDGEEILQMVRGRDSRYPKEP